MSAASFSLFLLAVFAFCGRSLSVDDPSKIETEFLGKHILSGIDESQYCNDPYAAFCGSEDKNRTRPVHLKQAYQTIRNYLINILSQPIAINEVTALSVEKSLYRQCMNIGTQNDSANIRATELFIRELFRDILDIEDTWQNMDKHLNEKGFAFTFFDITVERDPMNPRQHIVVIQPPSLSRINNLIDWADMVFQVNNYPDPTSFPWKLYNLADVIQTKRLYNHWAKILSESKTQRKQEKMTLRQWHDQYDSKCYSNDEHNTEIDWKNLVKQTLKKVDIEFDENESIIVRNKDYFFSLVNLFREFSTYFVTEALKTTVLLENYRLINYKVAERYKHRKKSLFCYGNTNLYGASFRLLRDLKRDESNEAEHYDILNEMILSIADVVLFGIDDASNLTPKEQRYLRTQVKLITSHVVRYKDYRDIVDDYYENYDINRSYFVSILNYRKMLKEKELSRLTTYTQHLEPEPFSVIDLAKPRNRFIVNVFASSFILSKQPIPTELQREVHYGIYGISIAGFLYGLLNENRYNQEVDLSAKQVNWLAHPNFASKSLQCFVGQDVKTYGRSLAAEAVTQIFGAEIANSAVIEDYEESELKRPKEFLIIKPNSELLALDADKLLFMSYGKYHCHLGKKVLNTVLLNLNEYNTAFECKNSQPQCPLEGFELQNKHYFVNQPF